MSCLARYAKNSQALLGKLFSLGEDGLLKRVILLKEGEDDFNSTLGVDAHVRLADAAVDTKERGAMTSVWPGMILLLCHFHVRQCWKNRRKQLKLGSIASFWGQFIEQRLRDLEER